MNGHRPRTPPARQCPESSPSVQGRGGGFASRGGPDNPSSSVSIVREITGIASSRSHLEVIANSFYARWGIRGFRARPAHQPRRLSEGLADPRAGCLVPTLFPIYRILRPREFTVPQSPCSFSVGGSPGEKIGFTPAMVWEPSIRSTSIGRSGPAPWPCPSLNREWFFW